MLSMRLFLGFQTTFFLTGDVRRDWVSPLRSSDCSGDTGPLVLVLAFLDGERLLCEPLAVDPTELLDISFPAGSGACSGRLFDAPFRGGLLAGALFGGLGPPEAFLVGIALASAGPRPVALALNKLAHAGRCRAFLHFA